MVSAGLEWKDEEATTVGGRYEAFSCSEGVNGCRIICCLV